MQFFFQNYLFRFLFAKNNTQTFEVFQNIEKYLLSCMYKLSHLAKIEEKSKNTSMA
jgi:hypothetical protein